MSLRNLSLKEIYRSDRDDIISEFFVPCLANCIEYSRCVERISAKSLTTIILAIGDDPDTRVRIVSGHRFGAGDIALMNKIFSKDGNRIVNDFIRDTKINRLRQAVNGNHLAVKVAVPNDEEISGIFTERVGIFTDKAGDVVAFTGTSSHTFDKQGEKHKFSAFGGLDSLVSMSEMPTGSPVACVGVNKAENAGIYAAKILANEFPDIAAKLVKFKNSRHDAVLEESEKMRKRGIKKFSN